MTSTKSSDGCAPPDECKVRKAHSVTFTIPMKKASHAEIIRASLQADPEPERSRCHKSLEVVDGCLKVHITGEDTKNLRNATTNFFELFDLVLQTIDQFGEA